MKRRVHNPLAWAVVLFAPALAVLVFLTLPAASETPAKDKPPKIDEIKHKNFTDKLPGTEVKFDMIAIPGGTYTMGSDEDEKGRKADEGPRHPVTVKPFWMGKCEVTWDEFDKYWKEENAKEEKPKKEDPDAITRPTPPYADETFGHGREGHPVLCITHHAAIEYCRWLSKKTGKHYRLPTEAEWEWACRAGTTTPYSFGDPSKIGDYAWYAGNSEETTQEVGKKKPNPWGLHDMHGNLAEWCLDHYEAEGYKAFPADKPSIQPVLMPTDKRFSHVARGGSWFHKPEACRSASRLGSEKTWIKLDPQRPQSIWWLTSAEWVGFRVVVAVEEQENLKNIRSKVTKESK